VVDASGGGCPAFSRRFDLAPPIRRTKACAFGGALRGREEKERERTAVEPPVAMSMPRSRRCVDECVNERCVDEASARRKRVPSAGAGAAAVAAAASAVAVAAS